MVPSLFVDQPINQTRCIANVTQRRFDQPGESRQSPGKSNTRVGSRAKIVYVDGGLLKAAGRRPGGGLLPSSATDINAPFSHNSKTKKQKTKTCILCIAWNSMGNYQTKRHAAMVGRINTVIQSPLRADFVDSKPAEDEAGRVDVPPLAAAGPGDGNNSRRNASRQRREAMSNQLKPPTNPARRTHCFHVNKFSKHPRAVQLLTDGCVYYSLAAVSVIRRHFDSHTLHTHGMLLQ